MGALYYTDYILNKIIDGKYNEMNWNEGVKAFRDGVLFTGFMASAAPWIGKAVSSLYNRWKQPQMSKGKVDLNIEKEIKSIIFGDHLQEIRQHAKKVTVFDEYCEIVTHEGKVIRIEKNEMPNSSFNKLNQLVTRQDDVTAYGIKTYEQIRALGLDDVEAVAKNTGYSIEDIIRMKTHLFLKSHEVPQSGGILVKFQHFTPDDEIAYVWTLAQKKELTPSQKDWFDRLAKHELVESEYMKNGDAYVELSAWNGNQYSGNPPGAHDKAPAPPKASFPGFEEFAWKYIYK